MTKSTTRQAADVAHVVGRKNLLINGGFQVSQRGDYTSASSATNDSYSLDRWRDWSGIARTFQHTTGLTINGTTNKKGFKYVATSASSASYMGARQKLEGEDVPNGAVVTSSCMMRTNNANARIRTYGIVSGGVTSAACPPDGNWHKVTLTQTTNTVGTPEVGVLVYNDNETTTSIAVGDYIEVADFQLELGSVATDFEHRSYGEELALCQRYFCHSGGDGVIPSLTAYPASTRTHCLIVDIADSSIPSGAFPVEMRANPTITSGRLYTYNWGVYKNVAYVNATKGGIWLIGHDGGYSTGTPYWYVYIADAEL